MPTRRVLAEWQRWRRRRHLPFGYTYSEAFWESDGLFLYEHRNNWGRREGEAGDLPPYPEVAWDAVSESRYRVALGGVGGQSAVRHRPPPADELLPRLASGRQQQVFWSWAPDPGWKPVGGWWAGGSALIPIPDKGAWDSAMAASRTMAHEYGVILVGLATSDRLWEVASVLCGPDTPTFESLLAPGDRLVAVTVAVNQGDQDALLIASTTPIKRPPALPPATP